MTSEPDAKVGVMSTARTEHPIDEHVAIELEHVAASGVPSLPRHLDLYDVTWAGTACPTILQAEIVDDGRLVIEGTPPNKHAIVEDVPQWTHEVFTGSVRDYGTLYLARGLPISPSRRPSRASIRHLQSSPSPSNPTSKRVHLDHRTTPERLESSAWLSDLFAGNARLLPHGAASQAFLELLIAAGLGHRC